LSLLLAACGDGGTKADEQVIIYSNADDEAIAVIENALKDSEYKDDYILQPIGTSELGGKMLAEGTSIEADIVTMSSYYIDSAQEQNNMFIELGSPLKPLDSYSEIQIPLLGNIGSIFVNTELLKEKNLDMPKTIKDLTEPEYKNLVSIPNVMDSSTGWLLIQAIIAEYGEKEGKQILADLLENAGPHLESSGSGPIKKVQTGEVAIGFGLRTQAVDAKRNGLPIENIDPIEGNYTLVESIAVVDKKDDEKEALAAEIAQYIAEKARSGIIEQYPVPIYEGETIDEQYIPARLQHWESTLTVELLQQHQTFFKEALGGN
jgi:iron(III) transport system substrate-binding protein